MLTTVHLNGPLGAQWGRKFKLNVSTPRQVIDLIEAGKPGFRRAYLDMPDYVFRIRIGKRVVRRNEAAQLDLPMREDVRSISITPILEAHISTKGLIETIAGVVLFAVGVIYGQPQIALFGLSLTLSGVATLIAGSPKTAVDNTPSANKPSFQFSGPQNIVNEGGCVPVLIGGPLWIGSNIISEGIFNTDITQGSTTTTPKTGGDGTSNQGGASQAVPAYAVHGGQ